MEVNDPTNSRGGSFDISTLSTDNIERIEIVRAPLSVLYGSDALSGVINIITRRGKAQPDLGLEVSGGRFGAFRQYVHARGLKAIADYALSVSYLNDGEPVEGSKFISKTANMNLGLLLPEEIELRTTVRYADVRSETFPDDSGGPELAVIRSTEDRHPKQLTLGIDLSHNPFRWWNYTLRAGLYNSEDEISSPGVAPGERDPFGIPASNTDSSFSRYEAALLNTFSLAQRATVVVGAELRFEEGSSRGDLLIEESRVPTSFDLDRRTWAAFLEVQLFPWPNLLVQAGTRIDFPEDFDHEITPRLGASYSIETTGTTLRGSWGEGFKLPSFFALGNPLVGNSALVPEKSRSLDIGVTQSLWKEHVTVGVNYFDSEFIDLVDLEEGPPLRLVNRSKVTSRGVELIAYMRPHEALQIKGHLTHADTDIRGTEEELRNRPEWWGGFSARWRPLKAIELNLDGTYVGKVLDSSIPTGDVSLDPYARFDLAAAWRVHEKLKVFLIVENVFDAEYEQFVGFTVPGINPRFGLQYAF
jgi:iron complex outermembrane receptor protein/vitamin B12 transporter